MLRLRVPGCILSTRQLRGLAEIANECGSGRLDITTRSNLQIREFQPKDIIRVLTRLDAIGMSSRGSGADNIRNITASPITGIDPDELLDVAPLAEAITTISSTRATCMACQENSTSPSMVVAPFGPADTNDIGFVAVHVADSARHPAGIYFRVLLCGITGHKQFATDCGLLLRPSDVAVAAAMIRVFNSNGDRTDRKKARLKYLVDNWGADRFIAETEKRLAFPLLRVPAEACEPRKPIDRAGHIGVHAQRQAGMHYIGVVVPVGRLPVPHALALADIADRYGSGEVRFTVWQNLSFPTSPPNILRQPRSRLIALRASISPRAACSAAPSPAPATKAAAMPPPIPSRRR